MQHSTTLHQASEWPVLLLNNTYIILIRSDHHRFMISFLGGWLQVFFLFNPFLGGVVGVMGFISWAKMTTWRVRFFWTFLLAHQAPWTESNLATIKRTSTFSPLLNPFMEIKDIIASQEFAYFCETLKHFFPFMKMIWWGHVILRQVLFEFSVKRVEDEKNIKNHRSNSPKPHRRGLRSLVLPPPPPSSPQSSTTTGRLVLTAQPSNPSNRRSRRANNSGTDLPPLEPSFSTRFT